MTHQNYVVENKYITASWQGFTLKTVLLLYSSHRLICFFFACFHNSLVDFFSTSSSKAKPQKIVCNINATSKINTLDKLASFYVEYSICRVFLHPVVFMYWSVRYTSVESFAQRRVWASKDNRFYRSTHRKQCAVPKSHRLLLFT